MLTSCGVIVEYNPFHSGHSYHLKEAREKSKADVIVAVMSGNFLQRGEPAIVDKWDRANVALSEGADLVIELPVASAVQSADYFAAGGVSLLSALNVEHLCFGTDTSTTLDYNEFGLLYNEKEVELNNRYQEIKNNGQSYPKQMMQLYAELFPEIPVDFSSPNHVLGLAYAKENAKQSKPMMLHPIVRQGAHYHDSKIQSDNFSSATAIRKNAHANHLGSIKNTVPEQTLNDLYKNKLHSWNDYWPYLQYMLLTQSLSELSSIYQMTEGLEYRLKEAVKKANNFDDFIERVKTKRYTRVRIQRLCVYVLLQVKQSEIEHSLDNKYIRILGFTEQGRAFLKQEKNRSSYPIITKIDKKNEKQLALDIKAGQVYGLADQLASQQDYYRSPIYQGNKKR